MGGKSAWRKRQANGDTAKGVGGAIARHRPHLQGPPIKKGTLRGGNPKKGRGGRKDYKMAEEEEAAIDESAKELRRDTFLQNVEYCFKKAAWTILGYYLLFSLLGFIKWAIFVDWDKGKSG